MTTYDPTPAQVQWLSLADRLQLERDLADLPELAAILDREYFALLARGDRNPDDHAIRYPIATAVADLADRRWKTDTIATDPALEADTARRIGARRLGIAPTLASWVSLAVGEMHHAGAEHTPPMNPDLVVWVVEAAGAVHQTRPGPSVTSEAGWLRRHLDWIVEQQWVTDLAGEIRAIVSELDQLGINLDGPDERACMTADHLAELFEIHRSTIERWYRAGHLTDVGKVDRKRVFIVREVRTLVEHPPWERAGASRVALDQISLTLGQAQAEEKPERRHLRWGSARRV